MYIRTWLHTKKWGKERCKQSSAPPPNLRLLCLTYAPFIWAYFFSVTSAPTNIT